MNICIRMKLKTPLNLPIAYNHLIQSWIYSCIENSEGLADLHDNGYKYGKRNFKFFTFGPLEGHYRVTGNRIIFSDLVSLEIRSINDLFENAILNKIQEEGILLGQHRIMDVYCEVKKPIAIGSDIIIKMKTPIVAYYTTPEKQTLYLRPTDDEFFEEVAMNAYRKYCAATEIESKTAIELHKIDVRAQDKVITRYKGFIIEGYKGTYRLKGEKEQLEFLYYIGLGSKNSQGFGMFDVIE